MKKIGSARRKTKWMYAKKPADQGKLRIRAYMQEFGVGDRVGLKLDSAFQKGIFFRRFQGKTGVVTKKIGDYYEVSFNDLGKDKSIITHPVHMKKVK